MNRKILTAFAAALIVGTASAVTSSNTVCRIVLETTTQDNLISVPLVGCTTNHSSGANALIPITNFVMTTGLPASTVLIYNDGSSYKSWQLTNAGGAWTGVAVVRRDGISYVAGANEGIQRGKAFRLSLPSKPSASGQKIYLCGQYFEAGFSGDSISSAGSSSAPVYTLVGVGQPAEYTIETLVSKIGSAQKGDGIGVPSDKGMTQYEYDSGWKKVKYTSGTVTLGGIEMTTQTKSFETIPAGDKLPAGAAFWYITRGASGTRTFTW